MLNLGKPAVALAVTVDGGLEIACMSITHIRRRIPPS
jgi:hypothetical protein